MKATLKLLEALGLIIAMAAWIIEWSVVREWEQAGDDLRSSIASIQDAHGTAHTSAVVQLEAAVSRATTGRAPPANGPNSYYAAAWDSPEVRAKWANRTVQDFRLLDVLSTILQMQQQEYGLRTDSSLIAFRQQLGRHEAEFRTFMDSTFPLSIGPATPDRQKIRGRDAGHFDEQVGQLHVALAPVVTATFLEIQQRRRSRSIFFRVVFGLGSLLLVTAKVLEWRVESRELNNPLQLREYGSLRR